MKTQILQLEAHDDMISTRDKMGWGQTGRILLVWPEKGEILTRRLDLVLLQRHSASLGAQLALVTHDPDVRFHAQQLAIPVFKTLRQGQSVHWRVPRRLRRIRHRRRRILYGSENGRAKWSLQSPRPPARPLSPTTRLAFFTLGVLALLSIGAILLPSAEVVLAPKIQSQEITLSVQADSEQPAVNFTGKIPARSRTVIVEGRDSLPVTGSIRFPDQKATGRIRFTNLTEQPVEVPKGSIISTVGANRVRFATTQVGTVPAGAGQTLTLPAAALSPGTKGNLPEGRLIAIEGLLGTQVTAGNPQATRGGRDRVTQAPSSANRRDLYKKLLDSLRQTALEELQNGLEKDDLLLTSSPDLLQTLEEVYEPAENQPADQLGLSLRLEFQALVCSGIELRSLAEAALNANLPNGFTPVEGSLEIQNLSLVASEDGSSVRWRMRAHRNLQAQFPETQAIRLSLGLSRPQAEQRLASSLPLESSPQIALRPGWWPRLPVIPFRINVFTLKEGD